MVWVIIGLFRRVLDPLCKGGWQKFAKDQELHCLLKKQVSDGCLHHRQVEAISGTLRLALETQTRWLNL